MCNGDFSSEIRIYHYHSLQSGMSTLVYELIAFSTENDRKHPRKYALGRATHRKSLQNTSAASTHPREGIRMCSGSLRVDSGRFWPERRTFETAPLNNLDVTCNNLLMQAAWTFAHERLSKKEFYRFRGSLWSQSVFFLSFWLKVWNNFNTLKNILFLEC